MESEDAYFAKIEGLLEDPSGFSLSKLKSESEKMRLKDKKSVVDVALRRRMLRLLACHSLEEVKSLLKMGVAAALANICSAPTPFLLFADVFNTKPISVCQQLFGFMEETITTLKDVPLFGSGRNTLLRMCNDLLRRLSKSQNTAFCGQIQLFLSRLFPLDEKSGLNLMSNFNVEKEIVYNKAPDMSAFKHQLSMDGTIDDLEEGETTDVPAPVEVDASLYVKFWSIQEFFKIPTLCYDKNKWTVFQHSTETVLEVFSSIKLQCAEDMDALVETSSAKFSKYLTSEKLLDLQLMDSSFRRYILVQLLLVFQYLTTPTKFKTPEQVMNEDQISWIHRKRESILQLLYSRKADEQTGDSFLSTVERILEREVLWNRWKNEGCPSFVRSAEKLPTTPRKRRMNPLVDRSGNKIYRFGNRTLDELWNACPDNLAACRDERRLFRPDLSTYFQEAILQLDPEEKVEEEYKYINKEEWCWRALRCLSRRCPYFYINWHPPGRPVKDYLTVILTEKLQTEDDRKTTHDSGSATSSANRREVSNNMTEPSPAKQPRLDPDVVTDGTHSTHSNRSRHVTADGDISGRRGVTSTRRDSSHPTGITHQQTDIYDQDDSVLDEDDICVKQDGDPDSSDRLVEGDSNDHSLSEVAP